MVILALGRFILRFAIVAIILASWCPFILGSRLRSFPASPGETLSRLKIFMRRWAIVFAIFLAIAIALGYSSSAFGSGLRLDFLTTGLASLAVVFLWRATELVWPTAGSSPFRLIDDARPLVVRECATFALRLLFTTSATLVWWNFCVSVPPCLSPADDFPGSCRAINLLWRFVRFAYRDKTAFDMFDPFVIGVAVGVLAVELTVVFLWRMMEVGANAWLDIEGRVARRLLSPSNGFALLYSLALVPCAAFWALAVLLRFRWDEILLGPVLAGLAVILHGSDDAAPPIDEPIRYVPPLLLAAAVLVARLVWRNWRLRTS